MEVSETQMEETSKVRRGAFFASRLHLPEDLRQKVHQLGQSLGQEIWVSDISAPAMNSMSLDQVQIACLKQVRRYSHFVCVLDGSYGSPWNASQVSILELELFMAALTRRQIRIFLLAPFNKDPRLASLLDVVKMANPACLNETPLSVEKILSAIGRILDSETSDNTNNVMSQRNVVGRLKRFLAQIRSPKLTKRFTELDVQYLNGTFAPLIYGDVDKEYLELLVKVAGQEKNIPDKLAQLWVVIRHLSNRPYTNAKNKDFVQLWDKALSHWASASAWYGLHGHLFLGRLAAVNTLLIIRSDVSLAQQSEISMLEIQGTSGAIASEYYSIAKSVDTLAARYGLMKKALWNANFALDTKTSGDTSGLLLIRGSIHLYLAEPFKALTDFQDALAQRMSAREQLGRIGEAETKLGLAYFYVGNLWKAQKLLEAAVDKLESSDRNEFTVQALRNLGSFYKRTLRWNHAANVLLRAKRLAEEHEIQGQLQQMKDS